MKNRKVEICLFNTEKSTPVGENFPKLSVNPHLTCHKTPAQMAKLVFRKCVKLTAYIEGIVFF